MEAGITKLWYQNGNFLVRNSIKNKQTNNDDDNNNNYNKETNQKKQQTKPNNNKPSSGWRLSRKIRVEGIQGKKIIW